MSVERVVLITIGMLAALLGAGSLGIFVNTFRKNVKANVLEKVKALHPTRPEEELERMYNETRWLFFVLGVLLVGLVVVLIVYAQTHPGA